VAGERLSAEIEEFLHTHPMVSDVQVIGVPDAKYGEEVCAWIRLREGHAVTAEDIREYCRGQIASYKIPRYVRFTTEFPMTVTARCRSSGCASSPSRSSDSSIGSNGVRAPRHQNTLRRFQRGAR